MSSLCIHQWFESQAKKTPGAAAVVFENHLLTYGELDKRANQLAHRLRRLGVGPDILVALCLERSLELIVGVLGVLKAGGAYLPLDLAYPKERLAFMLQDAEASILLTQHSLASALPVQGMAIIDIDDDFSHEPDIAPIVKMTPDQLAYCIYTSGSTGKPKGVLITHRNVVRLFTATEHWFGFGPTDVWTLFHSSAFDVSVWEMWGALLYGGHLVVVPYLVSRSPSDFYELLERESVTVLSQTPSAFRQLLWAETSSLKPRTLQLRYIIFAGEKLELQMLRPWFDRHGDKPPQLINMYGITETTVHVTYRPITASDIDGPSVIGPPIPDLQIHLLDKNSRPVTGDQPGEICVAGPGVARGYLNREDLTAARFVKVGDTRLYRSGDLARRLPDGDLEYIGRIDNQVKIRGHRIELGEIESTLHRHGAVRAAVVISRGERLTAYIVAKGTAPTVTDLRDFVKQHLPEYMVPAAFVFLDELPLTTNGKVDRRALPDPGQTRPNLMQEYMAPQTTAELILAGIWSQVLDVAPVGVDDNFFELGGDSIRMIQVLAQEKGLALTPAQLFETPTIRALADHADHSVLPVSERHPVAPFAMISKEDHSRLPVDIEGAYPLAALQAGMHYHSELEPASGIFHDVFSYRVGFPFDARLLEEALHRLVARHEILRTVFDFVTYSEPIQLVHGNVPAVLGVEDLQELTPAKQDEALLAWIEVEKRRPFNCEKAPLARFHIQRYGEQEFQLFVSFYHAVLDGWSLAVMVSELLLDYAAAWQGKPNTIESPKTFYREYVARERDAVISTECRRFWADHLKGAPRQVLPRWPQSFRLGGIEQAQGPEIKIGPAVFAGLNQLAKTVGVPLRTVLLAAHFRMIRLLSAGNDVVSGVVMNGRPEERDGERILGLFLNVVPMRMNLAGATWLELVEHTYAAERALLPYRRYPLSEIQRQLDGLAPFEAAFNYVNWHVFRPLQERSGMEFQEGHYFEANNFVLLANFTLDISATQLTFHIDYDPEQFAKRQIEVLGDYYLATLTAMAAEPENRYDDFCPMAEMEQQQLLVDWNATDTDYPRNKCIHELFEAKANNMPEAVALVLGDEQLTYSELNRRADRLSGHLRAKGVEPESLVGLCTERSLEMVVALLAILKAGGAYVPLDPSYPRKRLAWMIEDTGMKVLITQSELKEKLPAGSFEVICLDACQMSEPPVVAPQANVTADNLAYVIYTSGSTGTPKGVAVPHRGVVRLLFGVDYVTLDSHQTFLHQSPISFDASTFEVWGALLHGARCVLFPDKVLEPRQLGETVQRHGVTVLWLTAALYNAVIDEAPQVLHGVKQLLIGGEALSVDHVLRGLKLLPDTQVINGYGPTESTTFTCCYRIPRKIEDHTGSIPIGRPIGNTQVYILDARLKPAPVGVTGELFIGGDGLARGYLNRPELTAENFIRHPFADAPEARLYRTGDLVRYLPGGNIEFIGRRDHQVKIRGFRIELGEIEATLLQHAGVKDAVVLAREDQLGDKRLIGYVTAKTEPAPTLNDLWLYLKDKLPGYMVPGAFVFLSSMPLNTNGKVDRHALPAQDIGRPELEQQYEAPRTPTEEIVTQVWRNVLKLEQIGVQDNFFELGGHSLVATQIISRLRNVFYLDIPLRILFDNPTVAGLSECIDLKDNIL
jgi:amino acid adenylation domain-containing protein